MPREVNYFINSLYYIDYNDFIGFCIAGFDQIGVQKMNPALAVNEGIQYAIGPGPAANERVANPKGRGTEGCISEGRWAFPI
jgi:hypothetical protein